MSDNNPQLPENIHPFGDGAGDELKRPRGPRNVGAQGKPPRTGKRRPTGWIVAGGILVVLAGGYAGAALYTGSKAPAQLSVAGIDIGGQSARQATETLTAQLAPKAKQPVTIGVAGKTAEIDPAAAGLGLDVDATVKKAIGLNWDPRVIWERLTGSTTVEPVVTADSAKLRAAIGEAAGALDTKPVDAGVVFQDGTPKATPATEGRTIVVDGAVDAVREGWLSGKAVEVPATAKAPAIPDSAAAEALKGIAEPAVSAPIKVKAGDQTLTVKPAVIAATLTFAAKDGKLQPVFDADELAKRTLKDNPDIGDKARDAKIELKGGKPVVVPGVSGKSIAGADLAQAITPVLGAGERTATVKLTESQPKVTTADIEKLGIKEVISEFATPYNSEANRDTNLKVATRHVTGTILKPGQQFSLNKSILERTAANGYKQADVISNGQLVKDFGGGVSQVSTTLFNGAFFAGLQLDDHRAHSRWISRYPEGRESTLDWRTIDMKFTNNTDHGIMLEMWLGGGEVHARLWGTKTVKVTASKSDRFAYTSGTTIKQSGSSCRPQSAAQGWSVKIGRTIKDSKSGKTLKTDGFTTVYRPVNRVTCG